MKAGLGWVSFFSFFQLVLNFALTVALARLLTPSEFGEFALALVIVTFFQVFAQLGINAAIVQIKETDALFFATAFTLVLSTSTFLTLFSLIGLKIWLVAHQLQGAPNDAFLSALRLLLLSLPFFAVADFYEGIFNRNLAFRAPAKISFVSFVIGYAAIGLTLANLGFGSYALAIAYLTQHAMRAFLLFFSIKNRPYLAFHIPDVRRILRFGVGFSIAKIGNVSALQADNLIVASYLGNAALGLYSRSYQLIMSPVGLIATIVDRVLFPAMSRRQDNIPVLRSAFLLLNGTILSLFLPLSLILFEFRQEIVLVVLGSSWAAASGPFGYLAIGLAFRAAYRVSDIVARARGIVYSRAVVQWIYAGLIVAGGVIGQHWGLDGVAIGISSAIAVNWMLMTILTTYSLEITLADILLSFRPAVFTLCVAYLAVVVLNLWFERVQDKAPTLTVAISLGFGAALIAVLNLRSANTALSDWKQILRRASRAD